VALAAQARESTGNDEIICQLEEAGVFYREGSGGVGDEARCRKPRPHNRQFLSNKISNKVGLFLCIYGIGTESYCTRTCRLIKRAYTHCGDVSALNFNLQRTLTGIIFKMRNEEEKKIDY